MCYKETKMFSKGKTKTNKANERQSFMELVCQTSEEFWMADKTDKCLNFRQRHKKTLLVCKCLQSMAKRLLLL